MSMKQRFNHAEQKDTGFGDDDDGSGRSARWGRFGDTPSGVLIGFRESAPPF